MKEHVIMEEHVITIGRDWCKTCQKNENVEVIEIEKNSIVGVVLKCLNCGTITLLPIDLKMYSRSYRQKGGKHAYQENKSKKFHES